MNGKVRRIKVTLKPVGDGCNLVCEHCFVAGEPSRVRRMDDDTLLKVHQRAADYAEHVSVVWHGGEPLLAGMPFFERALWIQGELPAEFNNVVQSNFTLLDDRWADFLVANHIAAGTSLDGVPAIHDAVRHYADGRGSYDMVLAGIERLRSRGMSTGAIATFTKYMLGRHMEVYDAFRDLHMDWQLNPMLKSARGNAVTNRVGVTFGEYADAMVDIIDRYLFDEGAPVIDTVDDYIAHLVQGSRREKSGQGLSGSCQDTIVAVGSDGSVYPCGRFTTMPETVLGNVHTDSMEKIFAHSFKGRMRSRGGETVGRCGECEYKRACDAGCSEAAYYYHADPLAEDPMCSVYKRIYGHIIEVVTKLKTEVKQCQLQ